MLLIAASSEHQSGPLLEVISGEERLGLVRQARARRVLYAPRDKDAELPLVRLSARPTMPSAEATILGAGLVMPMGLPLHPRAVYW